MAPDGLLFWGWDYVTTWLHWDDYECRETANHQPISNSWDVVERRFRIVAQMILFNEFF